MTKRIRAYTPEELAAKKTLSQGQCCDLKVQTTYYRVWLCRTSLPDGCPPEHVVSYERLYQGKWLTCSVDGHFY